VLDSGAVSTFAQNRALRVMVQSLLSRGWDVVVPTVVLAETVTGRAADAMVNRTVNELGTEDTNRATARFAGALRHRSGRPKRRAPSGIDAIVAAHAVLREGRAIIFTSDPKDLQALTAAHPSVRVERVS
jgi:predicted nucleic acid-binding protein